MYATQVFLTRQGKATYSTKEVYQYFHAKKTLSAEGRQYKQRVGDILNSSGVTTRLREFIALHGTVSVTFYLKRPNWFTRDGRPNRNAGDCSNRRKILQDVIFEAIGVDDSAVFQAIDIKMHGEKDSVDVLVTPLAEAWDLV